MLDSLLNRDAPASHPTYVAPEVSYLQDRIVNVVFVGNQGAGDRGWVLVDAGMPGSAGKIREAAATLFGAGARPAAIVLTHGHFDHVGSVHTLAEEWDAPVYAHQLELPYLTGRSSYPPPDPFVGGGGMAAMSFLFPKGPIDLGTRVHALPSDGSVPGMPGWRWLPTPGHAPGHVSLVRDSDRTCIAGDAFVTTKQESMIAAITQRTEMHGPPMYFTPDWGAAHLSVQHLADYAPTAAVTGHGAPMRGEELRTELRRLARHFRELAVPNRGRYRDTPAIMDESGVVTVPPPQVSGRTIMIAGAAVGALVALGIVMSRRGDREVAVAGSDSWELGDSPVEENGATPFDYGSDQPVDDAMLQSVRLSTADGGFDPTGGGEANPS